MSRPPSDSKPAQGPLDVPAVAAVADAAEPGYTDYILRSTAPTRETGWKYNIMKFAAMSDRLVDPSNEASFSRPVRLNRKDPRTVRRLNDEETERINRGGDTEMLDGEKPELEEKKGKKVREEMDLSLVGTGTSGIGPTQRTKGSMFKKKTNRVFVSSEEARRLKREEWMPWVLEDSTSTTRWIGRLEGGTGEQSSSSGTASMKSAAARSTAAANAKGTGMSGWRPPAMTGDAGAGGSCYVAFVFPESGEDFKVYPANRWYKFGQGPKYVTLGTEEAEDEYNRQEKKQASERWIMQRRAAAAASTSKVASGSSTPLAPSPSATTSTSNGNSNARSRLQEAARRAALQIPGSSKFMKTVLSGNVDGEGGAGGKSSNRLDQSEDEFDFEEDFQDDEEGIAKIDDMADEDELKELNRRIKNEMRGVERIGMSSIAGEGQEEGDDEGVELDKEGKEVRRLFKRVEGNDVYDSDGEEENPYASQEDSSSDSTTSTPSTTKPKPKSTASLHRSSHSSRNPSRPTSRTGSPAPGGGSAMLAKRATSPGGGGRRSTPGSRSNSPARESSPGTSGGGKRRRDGTTDGGNESDNSKRRKAPSPSLSSADASGSGSGSTALITEGDIVAFFKMKATSLQTKDVLAHFKKALKGNPANKAAIGGLLMSVASLVDGNLILRPGL